jgi:hypothetical protein
MQPVTEEKLKELILEGREAGKDVSELEAVLAEGQTPEPQMGETRVIGKVVIVSTGPARERDFGR